MPENILDTHLRLTEAQLAEYWGIRRNTLQKWRSLGIGPVYIKLGAKVVYPRESILDYERNRTYRGSGERIFPMEADDEK